MKRLFLLTFALVSIASLWSQPPWSSLLVPEEREAEFLALLQQAEVPVLSWSRAVVEVSAFDGLETIPLAHLSRRLTPQDPRWDPWLRSVSAWFRPEGGLVPLWVPSERLSEARQLVGPLEGVSRPQSGEITPPLITGWTLIALGLLAAGLYLVAGWLSGWEGRTSWRRWLWVPVCLVALVLGTLLVAQRSGPAVGTTPVASASWLQHRWFQEAWPWGATWDDYAPDRAWSFRSYERREGRLTEVEATLTAADQTWADAVREGLEAHHAVRIFGTDHP